MYDSIYKRFLEEARSQRQSRIEVTRREELLLNGKRVYVGRDGMFGV